ncbi:MAG: cupin domain-containing protein [Pseudomonadota bacterium]
MESQAVAARFLVMALSGMMLLGIAMAEQSAITPILPEKLQWSTPPNIPAVRSAWILGSEQQAGTYAMRVVLASNGRIPPHTHPDTRYSTVLSGTLFVGLGTKFDPAVMVAVPAGGVYVAPAGVTHFLWAKGGEVVYQEAGVGPTGTKVLP